MSESELSAPNTPPPIDDAPSTPIWRTIVDDLAEDALSLVLPSTHDRFTAATTPNPLFGDPTKTHCVTGTSEEALGRLTGVVSADSELTVFGERRRSTTNTDRELLRTKLKIVLTGAGYLSGDRQLERFFHNQVVNLLNLVRRNEGHPVFEEVKTVQPNPGYKVHNWVGIDRSGMKTITIKAGPVIKKKAASSGINFEDAEEIPPALALQNFVHVEDQRIQSISDITDFYICPTLSTKFLDENGEPIPMERLATILPRALVVCDVRLHIYDMRQRGPSNTGDPAVAYSLKLDKLIVLARPGPSSGADENGETPSKRQRSASPQLKVISPAKSRPLPMTPSPKKVKTASTSTRSLRDVSPSPAASTSRLPTSGINEDVEMGQGENEADNDEMLKDEEKAEEGGKQKNSKKAGKGSRAAKK